MPFDPGCPKCQMWEDAGASYPRPCAEHWAGCYICHPDDPNAPEDGCEDCERDWQEYYYRAYARNA